MLNRHKYWKALLGTFADALIGKQVDYSGTGTSTVSTFAEFVASAAEGEVAIFNDTTLALVAGTTSGSPAVVTAAGTTTWLFAAVKRDTYVERTPKFRLDQWTFTRAAYSAPVAQLSKAAFTGSSVVGSYYSVRVIETTPGNQPFPSWEYGVTVLTGESLATALARLVALVNDTTNVINKGTDPIVTATLSTTTISFTATTAGVTFRLAFSANAINDVAATATYSGSGTANAFWGNGTYDQVAELERETDVYKGVGTQYPENHTIPSDWDTRTQFATSGVQYSIYIGSGYAFEDSPTPVERHVQKRTIVLAIPSNGSANADAEVKGILGL